MVLQEKKGKVGLVALAQQCVACRGPGLASPHRIAFLSALQLCAAAGCFCTHTHRCCGTSALSTLLTTARRLVCFRAFAFQVAAKDLTEKFVRLRDSKRQMQISRGRKPLSDSLNAGLMKNQDSMDVEMGPLDVSPDLPPEWVDLVRGDALRGHVWDGTRPEYCLTLSLPLSAPPHQSDQAKDMIVKIERKRKCGVARPAVLPSTPHLSHLTFHQLSPLSASSFLNYPPPPRVSRPTKQSRT